MTRTMNARALTAALLISGSSSAQISLKAEAKADSKDGASADAEADAKNDAEAPEAQAASSSGDAAVGAELPYIKRYVPEPNMWELGIFGGVMFPSSSHELYEPGRQDTQQGFKAAGEVGLRVAYFPLSFLGAEVEGAALPSAAKDGSAAGLWAGRAHLIAQLPGRSVTPFLLAGGGVLGAASDAMGSDSDPSINFGVGIKAALDEHIGFRLDLRDNLSQKFDADQGALTHHPEFLLGLVFTPERRKPDYDGDGTNDFRDLCPREAGEFSGCPSVDTDGDGVSDEDDACPEVASEHPSGCVDTDGDGVEDTKDACPDVAGKDSGGCPVEECKVKDSDGDGIVDSADECPSEAAKTKTGCPVKDQDGDGIPDEKDACVDEPETKNGFRDKDGCPDEVPEAVKKFDGVMEGIVFEFGSADISPKSFPKLKETVKIMKEFPSLHVEISGHTDSTGDAKRNDELSQGRADSVKKYLTDEGIEGERIETKGYGSSKPIGDNESEAGRSQNRRIEFHLVKE